MKGIIYFSLNCILRIPLSNHSFSMQDESKVLCGRVWRLTRVQEKDIIIIISRKDVGMYIAKAMFMYI